MMQNETILDLKNSTIKDLTLFSEINSYLAILIVGLGLIFNTITFLIFRFEKELKKMPSIAILSFVCISDTLSLFNWNLDHFLVRFDISISKNSVSICKFFTFMQYTSLEISGLLLSLCSIDRYFTITNKPGSFMSKLPFGTLRTSVVWSISIIIFVFILDSYLLFANRLKDKDKFECYTLENGFKIIETWEKVHLFIYSFIPFLIMTIFNLLLMKKTQLSKRIGPSSVNKSNQANKKNLTYTLLTISTAFLIMTLPSTIMHGFFYYIINNGDIILNIFYLLDNVAFFNHTTLFFNCLLSNLKFRNSVLNSFRLLKSCFVKNSSF
jgi:hypothetical protein